MLLSAFFEDLSLGELKHISIGGIAGGVIDTANYPTVISHINYGLTELFTRFLLKMDQLVLQQYDHIEFYRLSKEFAESNVDSTESYKYIKDGTQPFKENIIKIEQASDEEYGEVPINNPLKDNSIYTPEYNLVQIPYANEENMITLFYRAKHDSIPLDTADPSTVNIDLSNAFKEALASYVAYRSYFAMGNEGSLKQMQFYKQLFEDQCSKLKDRGMEPEDNEEFPRIERLGWV